jgi:hypothetical protein
MSLLGEPDTSSRPENDLLRVLSESDYALIAPHLTFDRCVANQTIYNPGDNVETVYFPSDTSVACFVLAVEDGREVQVVMIGREGAVGGIVSHGRLPAFSRSVVRIGGLFVRLPSARLEAANGQVTIARESFCPLRRLLAGPNPAGERLQRRTFNRAACREVDPHHDGVDQGERHTPQPRATCRHAGCRSHLCE